MYKNHIVTKIEGILELIRNCENYRKVLTLWTLLVFGSVFSLSAYSQNDSLFHYLELAAQNNPAVLQKFAEYQAALQKIPQAGSLPDPQLSVGIFLSPMELVNGKQVADMRLMQMFPWFGVLKYGKDEMSLMAKSRFELFRDAKLQLFYDVQRKWYELYKIEKNIYYSEKNIEIIETIRNLAIERFKTGSINSGNNSLSGPSGTKGSVNGTNTGSPAMNQMNTGQSTTSTTVQPPMQQGSMTASTGNTGLADVYRIQIESGDLENNIELLKSQKRTLTAQFNSFLNRPSLTPVFIPENIGPDSLAINQSALMDSLQTNNPMLGMIEYEKQSVAARKKMITRMGLPMVGIGLNYSLINKTDLPMGEPAMNGSDMIMPMVSLTLPVYRKKYNAMKSEAEFLKNAADYNYQSSINELRNEYYQSLQAYEDAGRRLRLYENQLLLATKTLDIIMKSYSASTSDLTEVLRARQQTYEFEIKHVEALTDLNTSIALMRRLGGVREIERNRLK